jgi:hypothetical protein
MTEAQATQVLAGQAAVQEPPKPGETPVLPHVPDPNAKSPWRQLTPEEVDAVAASATGSGTRIPPSVEAAPIPVVNEKSKTTITTDTNPPKTGGVKPVHIDGGLYAVMGGLSAFIACLSTDGAAKHIGPDLLWWLQTVAEVADGVVLSIKMYRSTGYADSRS